MKNRNSYSLITEVVVVMVLILYIFFLYIDFYNVKILIDSKYIKYLCILLCFLLSIISTKNLLMHTGTNIVNYRDISLLRLAMFITVIADLCLVIFDFYILGVALFSLVQIIYSVRYTTKKLNSTFFKFFIISQCIIFSYVIASLFIEVINVLLPISLFYSICLINSVIKAIKAWKNNLYPSPSKYMMVFGMILFLLCDICVALSAITAHFTLIGYFMSSFYQITFYLIWVFYIPSQLLLSLSGSTKIRRIRSL
ncbi:MAG: hypothetical protein ACI8WT_004714 [Clostridium sp.]|jgi:hypothetical protein